MIGASGLDWGHEAVASLYWIAKATAIAAVCFLAAMFCLIRFTRWGRQFWRISGGFFTGPARMKNWALFALVLVLAVFAVPMNVLFSYFYNDMYTSLQQAFQAIAQNDAVGLDAAKTAF